MSTRDMRAAAQARAPVKTASPARMSNIPFGIQCFGYYETLGGGSGTGPGFHGASAVLTPLTNSRITDLEVLGTWYPVLLEHFSIWRGNGGKGLHQGGAGLIRQYRFLEDLHVSLLTQRRETAPFGLDGGQSGARGKNIRVLTNGTEIPLAHAVAYAAKAGEELIIETLGGGGWGPQVP
jgi:5-oxoprolinase (ATP-hydrolysing)